MGLIALGIKLDNFIVDATDNAATNLKFTSTTTQEYTVPSGKRWWFYGGIVKRDTSSTLTIYIKDESDKHIRSLISSSAATGVTDYPSNVAAESSSAGGMPYLLNAGDYVELNFGTAQGAGAYASCVVIEVDI